MCGNYSSPNSENNFCSKECEIFDSLEFEDENFQIKVRKNAREVRFDLC